MKKFFADWRNSALLVAGAAIVALLLLLIGSDSRRDNTPIVRVNDTYITEGEVVSKLKRMSGDELIMKMVSDRLISAYAAREEVTASQGEIDQLLNMQDLELQMRGSSLDKALENEGMTRQELSDDLRSQVLQIKLLVPEAQIKAALAQVQQTKRPPFALPERYQYRQFVYNTSANAKQAIELLKSPDGMDQAVGMALNQENARQTQFYAPGLTKRVPMIDAALKGLQPGQTSKPLPVRVPGMKDAQMVIQLVKKFPAVQPTLENCNVLLGRAIMESGAKEYQEKVTNLEAKALSKVDVLFMNQDYKRAYERFHKVKVETPQIPGMDEELGTQAPPKAPGTGASPLNGK